MRGRRSVVVELPLNPRAIVILGPPRMGAGVSGREEYTMVELYLPEEREGGEDPR